MYNSKNHRNHNRSFVPSVLDHSRRWRSVAPVDTDEKRAPLDSFPSSGLTAGAPPPRSTGLHLSGRERGRESNASASTPWQKRKCKVRRHNRKESEEKKEDHVASKSWRSVPSKQSRAIAKQRKQGHRREENFCPHILFTMNQTCPNFIFFVLVTSR